MAVRKLLKVLFLREIKKGDEALRSVKLCLGTPFPPPPPPDYYWLSVSLRRIIFLFICLSLLINHSDEAGWSWGQNGEWLSVRGHKQSSFAALLLLLFWLLLHIPREKKKKKSTFGLKLEIHRSCRDFFKTSFPVAGNFDFIPVWGQNDYVSDIKRRGNQPLGLQI